MNEWVDCVSASHLIIDWLFQTFVFFSKQKHQKFLGYSLSNVNICFIFLVLHVIEPDIFVFWRKQEILIKKRR